MRSALVHVDCRMHRSHCRQLSTMVCLVTIFGESPSSLGRRDRVCGVCPRSFVTSMRKVKGQRSGQCPHLGTPLVDDQA